MRKILLAILFTFVTLIDGRFFNNHEYLMEQFRRYASPSNITSIDENYITQPVDHFNTTDQREWQMTYYHRMDLWRPGGPIIIFIGGESAADSAPIASSPDDSQGILLELAIETSGALFATEHRYYGKSKPFDTITVSNLKYLSSSQALADVANLIKLLKKQSPFSASKVVVVGGSYAGNLAAWMRLRYPDLVDAAIASSAPVLAKFDFFEYLDQVGKDFEQYAKPDCLEQISNFFTKVLNQIKSQYGIAQIKKYLGICEESDLTKRENLALLFNYLSDNYTHIAQYGTVGEIRNFCNAPKLNTSKICWHIDFSKEFNQNTLDPWVYQTCTEFGYFITSPTKLIEPFADISIGTDYFVKQCTAMFGPEFNQASIEAAVKKTNEMYGGLKPNVTNVVFVNGELDPWHRLSVLQDLSETVPARIIPEASHCADLFPNKGNGAIKKVQEEEKAFIKKWIGLTT